MSDLLHSSNTLTSSLQISIVIPLFNEDESLPPLHDWIVKVMEKNNFSYEIIFINDGSTDNSWKVIEELAQKNESVKAICFSRNYGKSAALDAGFKIVRGDVVITMDADLQDSPDEIPELYDLIKNQNFDLISGWKKKRHDPLSKTLPTKLFNAATRAFSGIKLNDFNCGLKAYKVEVVRTLNVYGEMHRYLPVLAKWNGFTKIGEKVVEHRARQFGSTKFGLERFTNGLLDLLSVTFITRFKKKPMHFFGTFGLLSFFMGFGIAFWLLLEKLLGIHSREPVDAPLFYISLLAISVGTQLFLVGFLAEMIVIHSNERNDYIISKEI
ncbi:glycosyltransferase family 2 protein [Bernardetia sp. OM2101]|uniref:glycosyltransferase family 2 protein n=1 Tax=Bernardetia sp. OM2101 TaxID=3344876 RepID=UPI0035CF7C98